jgi:hypothetical protein
MDSDDALDPHREEIRTQVVREIAAKLHARGIDVPAKATSDEIADLLDAVERWEKAVEHAGGDLYVDEGGDQPDDPAFALPQRRGDEPIAAYTSRIDAVSAELRHRDR